ncbi:MAG: hypothetical protein AB7O43_00620 [Hyphomicrobiaceae bacterium]
MLAYLAIFGTSLAGYAGVPPYAIAACGIALASISYAEHAHLYERGRTLGLGRVLNGVVIRSLCNGLLAAGMAYGVGVGLRWA